MIDMRDERMFSVLTLASYRNYEEVFNILFDYIINSNTHIKSDSLSS